MIASYQAANYLTLSGSAESLRKALSIARSAGIRTAVGDSAREAKYIKTVSKRGYQAVAPVIKQAAAPLEKDAEIIAVKENEFAGEDKETLVCVSYAYQDAAVVREAIKPLERQGVKVWHEKGEPTEANIPSVIDLSLSGSSALLFLRFEKIYCL